MIVFEPRRRWAHRAHAAASPARAAPVETADCFDEQTVLDLLGGDLPEDRLAVAERHLSACEACTDLLGATAPLLLACLSS